LEARDPLALNIIALLSALLLFMDELWLLRGAAEDESWGLGAVRMGVGYAVAIGRFWRVAHKFKAKIIDARLNNRYII
jgi:hypothetical protein